MFVHVAGYGVFTISHGPVRSGVMESMVYLAGTPGENIPHLIMRVFYKHRGIEKRYEGMTGDDGTAGRAHRGHLPTTSWPSRWLRSASSTPWSQWPP